MNRKCHEEQVALSVSVGLFIALCLIAYLIHSFTLFGEGFSLLIHTQGSSVATLILAIHHFSDYVSKRHASITPVDGLASGSSASGTN